MAHNSLILTFSTRKMLINVANLWLFFNSTWLFWLFLASDLAIFSYYNLATLRGEKCFSFSWQSVGWSRFAFWFYFSDSHSQSSAEFRSSRSSPRGRRFARSTPRSGSPGNVGTRPDLIRSLCQTTSTRSTTAPSPSELPPRWNRIKFIGQVTLR